MLLRHAEQVAMLESETLAALGGNIDGEASRVRLPVVVNADSLDSWFAEVFASVAGDGTFALDVRVEDQDHSERLLREGTVMAGVSTSAKPIQGCRVELLGVMRYLAIATPEFIGRHFGEGVGAGGAGRIGGSRRTSICVAHRRRKPETVRPNASGNTAA